MFLGMMSKFSMVLAGRSIEQGRTPEVALGEEFPFSSSSAQSDRKREERGAMSLREKTLEESAQYLVVIQGGKPQSYSCLEYLVVNQSFSEVLCHHEEGRSHKSLIIIICMVVVFS